MEKLFLVLVFGVGLFLKVSAASGAEGFLVAHAGETETTITNGDVDYDDEGLGEAVEEVRAKKRHKSDTRIQNNLIVADRSSNGSNAGTVSASMREDRSSNPLAIIPMAGGSGYQGNWNNHIGNAYSLGLALELTVSQVLALEGEVGYGRYNISYSYFSHDFNQYNYGGNAKFYLTRGLIQPWIGLGVMGVSYQNMSRGPYSNQGRYDETIGAGQLLAGADIALGSSVALGLRGAYIVPLFNRPNTFNNGAYAYPYYEEAAAINSAYYKLMASLKIGF